MDSTEYSDSMLWAYSSSSPFQLPVARYSNIGTISGKWKYHVARTSSLWSLTRGICYYVAFGILDRDSQPRLVQSPPCATLTAISITWDGVRSNRRAIIR
jgi:hypothetical protein